MKYITRKDNLPKMDSDNKLSIKLKEYPYILDKYEFRYDDYDLFIEIVEDNKVVGFLAFEIDYGVFSLTDTYILPEFRGKHLLLKQLLTLLQSGQEICIKEPTRDFVEVLLYYRFAEKLSDNLVATAFGFEISKENKILTNKHVYVDEEETSHLYDLDLCSPILLYDITTPGRCDVGYQKILKEDEKYCKEFRESLNIKKYFKEFKRLFKKNHIKFSKVLFELKDRIKLEEEFEENNEISEKLNKYVEEGIITQKRASELEKQINKEYNNNQVLTEGLEKRVKYLVKGVDLSKDRELLLKNLSEPQLALCSNCHQPVKSLEETSCHICGWNISNQNYLSNQEIIEIVSGNDEEITLDLRGNKLNELMDDLDNEEIDNDDILEKYNPYFKSLEYRLKVDIPYDKFEAIELINSDLAYLKNEYLNKNEKYSLNDDVEINDSVQYTYTKHQLLNGLTSNSNIYEVLKEKNIDDKSCITYAFLNDEIESKNYGEDYLSKIQKLHTIKDLKEILRKHDLKVSGNKDELIKRLIENGLFNELGENEFILTEKGKEILNNTGWIQFYYKNLTCFDFNDLGNFLSSKKNIYFRPHCEEYLNKHLEKAYNEKDFMKLHDTLVAKAICYVSWERYLEALNEELQLFMIKINPVYLKNIDKHEFITSSNIANIASLILYTNKQLKKIFNKNWKELKLDKTVINKKTALKYLTKLINGEDTSKINNDIKKDYMKRH